MSLYCKVSKSDRLGGQQHSSVTRAGLECISREGSILIMYDSRKSSIIIENYNNELDSKYSQASVFLALPCSF